MFGELRVYLHRLEAKQDARLKLDEAAQADKLLEFNTRIATRVLNAERGSIFIVDPENRKVWLKAGTGLAEHDIEVPTKGSVVGRVIETGETMRLTDLEKAEGAHRTTDVQTGFVTHNMLCVPVRDQALGETVGAIQVLNKKHGKDFDDEDEAFLKEMAEHVQAQVSLCYLNQEIFGLSEKVMSTAKKTVGYLLAAVGVLFLVVIGILFLWALVPAVA